MRVRTRLLGLATGVAGALAICGGVGASSALAAKCTNNTAIAGQGSSLQKIAQESVWGPGSGCKVTYTASGSAAGLEAFGSSGTLNHADSFVGTDDAPNQVQLEKMETAAKGKFKEAGKQQDVVFPVLQGSIAIIVKPPSGCDVTKISNKSLESIFNGLTLLWSEVKPLPTELSSKACEVEIERVVRLDGSGTTYQFKHYLFKINETALECTGTTLRKWSELQEEPTKNVEWPGLGAANACKGTEGPVTPITQPAAKGGKEEVEKVKTTADSIGYANLADAREAYKDTTEAELVEMYWVEAQKNGKEEEGATYAAPGTKGEEPSLGAAKANCASTQYENVPSSGSADQIWAESYAKFGASTNYPICTLSWDIGIEGYETAEYGAVMGTVGEATRQYMGYVTGSAAKEGQPEIENNHDYLALEEGSQKILKVAQEDVALINSRK